MCVCRGISVIQLFHPFCLVCSPFHKRDWRDAPGAGGFYLILNSEKLGSDASDAGEPILGGTTFSPF